MIKPLWLKQDIPSGKDFFELKKILSSNSIVTVCKEAKCPNIGTCWKSRTSTFMILGKTCTRNCRFCAVDHYDKKRPLTIDPNEPDHIARACKLMNLVYVVITMVTRDDLIDGGSNHLKDVINTIRTKYSSTIKIEVLTSDFNGSHQSLDTVIDAYPEVFAHNLETVESLTPTIRDHRASYKLSLEVLEYVKNTATTKNIPIITKSGLMLGLGEDLKEIEKTIKDLKNVGVSLLTFGQYLAPSSKHTPVVKYWTPEEFNIIKNIAEDNGMIAQSAPLVRSSFQAKKTFETYLEKVKTISAN